MAFAVYGLAVVFAPAIGPTLGGWITDNYSWRWIFFINIPVGILSLILTYRLVHDSGHAKAEHDEVWKHGLHIDYVGFGLVALGLGCLQVVLWIKGRRTTGLVRSSFGTLPLWHSWESPPPLFGSCGSQKNRSSIFACWPSPVFCLQTF